MAKEASVNPNGEGRKINAAVKKKDEASKNSDGFYKKCITRLVVELLAMMSRACSEPKRGKWQRRTPTFQAQLRL